MANLVVCSFLVNRPVRTRMPWWCGDWGLETPGYPISHFSVDSPNQTAPPINSVFCSLPENLSYRGRYAFQRPSLKSRRYSL